jgi:hypothetical protein
VRLALALAAALIALVALEAAASDHDADADDHGGDTLFLDVPAFPSRDVSDAFRLDFGSRIAPAARIGSGHVTMVRPHLALRATWPVDDRWVLRLSGQASTSLYRFRRDPTGVPSLLGEDLDLYATRLALESAYRITEIGPWFHDEEAWSLIGSVSGSSRWEDDGFHPGVGASGVLGFGYEIPDRLRIGLGVALRTSLERGGIDPRPFVSVRWDVTERFTLRTHDLGLRLEYDIAPLLELHLTGTRTSESFRLRNRSAVDDDLFFRDRHLRFSAGLEGVLANWLRLELELGALAERKLRVSGDDLGTLVSRRADPSVFFDIRIEIRL